MKEIQTYIKQLFQSGQNELQTRDVDKENKENDRPGISTCSSHVFTNSETTNPEFSISYCSKKISFSVKMAGILSFFNLFLFFKEKRF